MSAAGLLDLNLVLSEIHSFGARLKKVQQEKENAKATAENRLRRELSPRPPSRRTAMLLHGQPSLLLQGGTGNHLTVPMPTISSIISQSHAEEIMKRCEEIQAADSSATEKESTKATVGSRLRRELTQLSPRLRPRSRKSAALPQGPPSLLQPGGTRNQLSLPLPTISSIISQSNAEEIMKRCEEIRVADSSASTTRSNSTRSSRAASPCTSSQCNHKFGRKWNKKWRLRKEP